MYLVNQIEITILIEFPIYYMNSPIRTTLYVFKRYVCVCVLSLSLPLSLSLSQWSDPGFLERVLMDKGVEVRFADFISFFFKIFHGNEIIWSH